MISIKDVEHVARLARLALTEEEKTKYTGQLARIIEHFNELQQLETTGVEPMAHPLRITNVMRDDVVVQPLPREILLKNAPAEENGFFRVPRIGD